ncbi:Allene oxide synthase-lipoxygenase protein, partial [Globisporangium splendens]
MKVFLQVLALLASCIATNSAQVSAALSVPNLASEQEKASRAAEIQAIASQIKNEKRMWHIGDREYVFYDGPIVSPGSLAETIQQSELTKLSTFETTVPASLYALALQSPFNTIEDYANFYTNATKFMSKPVSIDISDENFGYQRTTVKGFNMRTFRDGTDSYPVDAKLTDAAVAQICGDSTPLAQLAQANRLFVTDYSSYGKWSESVETTGKFVAPVVGFFCYNDERKKLLPLAIRVVDTNLTYTPFDKQEEWTLAKMALDTADINYQQVQHFADTHAVFVPVRVEVLRNLASSHPVSALLLRTNKIDFALEQRAAVVLFNTSTILDRTFGFGASGGTTFFGNQLGLLSLDKDEFTADIEQRGLNHLPVHKYAAYGRLYHDAIATFIDAYLSVYYPSDEAVQQDQEVQNWAKGLSVVWQLRGFPSAFASRAELQKLLTHLLVQIFVRHHSMNGAPTWETMSVPYSTPGLWKKMPTQKLGESETLNILEYSTPTRLVPSLVLFSSNFKRNVPAAESVLALFQTAVFTDERALAPAIAAFESALKSIDETIVSAEQNELWPYLLLRPSMLPHYGWV